MRKHEPLTWHTKDRADFVNLAKFLGACKFVERLDALRRSAGESLDHPGSVIPRIFDLFEEGRILTQKCLGCGTEDRLTLPRPVHTMIPPIALPRGIAGRVWTWKMKFLTDHARCRISEDEGEKNEDE